MEAERPLQLAGTINAYCALLAERPVSGRCTFPVRA